MSLISCPLFTLQLKSYCSKIHSALAAAWLIPRLTLTELLPQALLTIPVHMACHKPQTSQSWGWPAAGQRGRMPLGSLSRTCLCPPEARGPLSREPGFPSSPSDMPAKAGSWCRPLSTGIPPCSRGLSWEQPTGSAGGICLAAGGTCPSASPEGSASQPLEQSPPSLAMQMPSELTTPGADTNRLRGHGLCKTQRGFKLQPPLCLARHSPEPGLSCHEQPRR